jgi:hypothetical protein
MVPTLYRQQQPQYTFHGGEIVTTTALMLVAWAHFRITQSSKKNIEDKSTFKRQINNGLRAMLDLVHVSPGVYIKKSIE